MKKKISVFLCLTLALSLLAGCGATFQKRTPIEQTTADLSASTEDTEPDTEAQAEDNSWKAVNCATSTDAPLLTGKHHIEIEVKDYGTIPCELDADVAPVTVTNFVNLANSGFYDGLTFHRIIDGFMIQGGDPTGTGSGGAPVNILGEFATNGVENSISHLRGTISMARGGDPGSASCQFFICQVDCSSDLDGRYAAFGRVTDEAAMDIVDQLCKDAIVDETVGNGMISPENQPVISAIRVID